MKKFFYRVQKGDTVISVAELFDVCFFDLIKDNNLVREITAGDILIINKDDCSLYKVKPSDTIESVSKAFDVSKEKILLQNSSIPYIFYGLKIKI